MYAPGVSMLLLATLLLGCPSGQDAVSETPSGSSMAASLKNAAQATPPAPDQEEFPERLSRESDRTVASDGSKDSKACRTARKSRDRLKERVAQAYEREVRPAEERAYQTQVALDACLKDMGGCGADARRYKAVAERAGSSERALQAKIDQIGVLSAQLYPLNEEVTKACGKGRY